MDEQEVLGSIRAWLDKRTLELIISIVLVVFYLISRRIIRRLVNRHAKKHDFDKSRILYVNKITGLVNFLAFIAFLGFTWEISLSGLSFYFASVFTVVGVALFANWSILSNLTASVILFFFFPFKVGTQIRIQDGDNSIEGVIVDITMFHVEIETTDGKMVSYPNNLAMQKPCVYPKK